MAAVRDMLILNTEQKAYYEARYDAYQTHDEELSHASWFTNLWWRARAPIADADRQIGVDDDVQGLHERWLGDLGQRAVLDLGCFTGNPLSLRLAERAASYRGVDLSEKAVSALNRKIALLNRDDAKAIAVDILDNDFPDACFDVIYAKSVLHHFADLDVLCKELERILKPGGTIISDDPLQTEPLNRIARSIYRPFQSDRDWEWPFTRKTLRTFQTYFDFEDMQGVRGFTRLALPFFLMPYLRNVGVRIGKWGWMLDKKLARSPNLFLYMCWNVTILMRKPG